MSSGPTNFHQQTQDMLAVNIDAAIETMAALALLAPPLGRATGMIGAALLGGHKLLCCGNGGSAADSAHFAAEIAGRYVLDRPGYPAIDLSDQHALSSALTNDYPAEQVFARMVQALGQSGDVLAVFSTSGNSANVRLALQAAKTNGLRTVAFLGRDGGKCQGLADVELIVPAATTARIQEAHQLLYHTLCEVLDPALARRAGEGQ
jgi:phosphoheptose isomerase